MRVLPRMVWLFEAGGWRWFWVLGRVFEQGLTRCGNRVESPLADRDGHGPAG